MANHGSQRLLVDTDAYCKLGVAGLLTDAMAALGVQPQECGRLPALPYMLMRGRLRREFGDYACDALARMADGIPVAIPPSDVWLAPLTTAFSIDPGEGQLLAASAEHGLLLLTGDKRGLEGVKDIPGYAEALDRRVVALEAVLIELCVTRGVDEIRERIRPLTEVDAVAKVCFSESNPTPLAGLLSYYLNLVNDLHPLNL